jgi:alpha-L-fucosidase
MRVLSLFVLVFCALSLSADDKDRDARLAWWRDARFGLFMHWGIYAVPAGEWNGLEKQKDLWGEWIMFRARIPVKEYEPLARRFNPTRFNADEWVRLAKRAGMRYLVITAKHCDGFAMFASKASSYNIVDATPFARDPMRELAAACRREGVKLGFYYSHSWDWHEPDALGNANTWDFPDRSKKDINRYLRSKSLPQVRELVTQYHPALMWFDVPSDLTRAHSQAFLQVIRENDPQCIVNDRVGNGLGDYDTPEQFIPRRRPQRDFEVCMTLNDHWGYDRNDQKWKAPPVVIRNLVETASKGGNYLLNVGPTAEGTFPPEAVKTLEAVGRWMDVNGESIHGTSAGTLGQVPWGYATVKGRTLYLHVFAWPQDGVLPVPGLAAPIRRARLLAGPQRSLRAARLGASDWEIHVPPQPSDPMDSVIALELDGPPAADTTTTLFPRKGYRYVLDAGAAVVKGDGAKYQGLSLQRREYDRIGAWTGSQTSVNWPVRVAAAGSYGVELTYSAEAASAGNTFVVTAGTNSLSGKVASTGGKEQFQTVSLGRMQLGPGRYDLEVKPGTMASGSTLLQLHAVTLVPGGKE